jgi:serine/threonine protein kinase
MVLQSNVLSSICINPECHQLFSGMDKCPHCGTEALLNGRYRLKAALRKLSPMNPISVFLGFDDETQQEVVIKVLDYPETDYKQHFQNEAGVLGNLRHPGLPVVDIDYGGYFEVVTTSKRFGDVECFVMEKVPGQTLQEYIEANGKISEQQAIQWLGELVEIIGTLHEKKVFHRDIKPSNIIVRPDQTLAMIDFGAVRQMTNTYIAKLGVGPDEVTKKYDVTVFISASYTAYEQMQGQAVPQSDFFSLGRTMVYAITGISPIDIKDEDGKLIWRHLAPQISPVFADYIDRLMALLVSNRPRNTQDIQAAIAQLPNAIKRHKIRNSPVAKIAGVAGIGLAVWGCWSGLSWYIAERYVSDGLSLAIEGDYKAARSRLESALMYSPNNGKIHSNLAAICQQIDSESAQQCAIEHSQKALNSNRDNNSSIHYNLGNLYEETGDVAKAIAQYELSLIQNPNFAPARNNLARIYIIQKKYADAKALMPAEFLAKQDKQSRAVLLKNLGWLQYQQQQYSEAAKSLKESIRLNPDETAPYCLMAKTIDASSKSSTTASQDYWQSCLSGAATSTEVEQWQDEKLNLLFRKKQAVS